MINDLTFLLCSYSESVCHEIIDQTWISTGIIMDRSKMRFSTKDQSEAVDRIITIVHKHLDIIQDTIVEILCFVDCQ